MPLTITSPCYFCLCLVLLLERTLARNLRLFPLKRGNSAEPSGLIPIKHLVPDETSAYAMDLHPLKQKEGAKVETPCGLSADVLGDLYGSRRLDLTGDPSKQPEAPESSDCMKTDPAAKGPDKGSGLVRLYFNPYLIALFSLSLSHSLFPPYSHTVHVRRVRRDI